MSRAIELEKFSAQEIDSAIEGLDQLEPIIGRVLRGINYEGKGKSDAEEFARHIRIAKVALITMGEFIEKQKEEKQ